MFQAGELIKFTPFVFKSGNQPKPKYFIVLGQIDDNVMMANLPTSKRSSYLIVQFSPSHFRLW